MQMQPHQIRATERFVLNEGGIAWHKPGEGKTRIALRTFAILQVKRQWTLPCAMVVACRRSAFYDWANEVKKCELNLFVWEWSEEKPFIGFGKPTIWLVSCDMLHKQWEQIFWSQSEGRESIVKMATYDELYLYGNPHSRRTKAAAKLTRHVGRRAVGLSGTIMPAQDNTTVWGQAVAVGLEHRLARNLTEFRERYQIDPFELQGAVVDGRKNKPGSKIAILQKLKRHVDIHFPKGRTLQQKISVVPITKQQEQLYRQLREEYYAEIQDHELDIQTALELTIKALQISDGWIKTSDGQILHIPTNKVSALTQSVSELLADADQRCVVWCAFRHDLEMLSDALPFPTLRMCGGEEFDRDAWEGGAARVVLATEASGSSVNHFAQVAYAKYFSLSFRWRDLQQSMARTDRTDSQHTVCHYEYFQVERTLDAHAFETANISGAEEYSFIKTGKLIAWLESTKTSRGRGQGTFVPALAPKTKHITRNFKSSASVSVSRPTRSGTRSFR